MQWMMCLNGVNVVSSGPQARADVSSGQLANLLGEGWAPGGLRAPLRLYIALGASRRRLPVVAGGVLRMHGLP